MMKTTAVILILISLACAAFSQAVTLSPETKPGPEAAKALMNNRYLVEYNAESKLIYLIKNPESRSRISYKALGNYVYKDLLAKRGKMVEIEGTVSNTGPFTGEIRVIKIIASSEPDFIKPEPVAAEKSLVVTNVVTITNVVTETQQTLTGLVIVSKEGIWLAGDGFNTPFRLYVLKPKNPQELQGLHGRRVKVTGTAGAADKAEFLVYKAEALN